MKIRALAIDLDGTLLTRGDTVSERNRSAVAAARAAGLEVIIATAGWYQRAEKVARQLDLRGPVIACSGAQVRRPSDGVDLMDVRMPAAFAAGLYRVLDGERCIAWVALDDEVLMKIEGTVDAALLFPEIRRVPSLAAAGGAPPRIALVQGTAANRAVVDGLAAEWGDRVRFITSLSGHAKSILTLTAVGADKGVALAVACRDLGVAPAEVVAIGDADNDIEMFRVAGGSFAMGQASAAVKAAARAVTATNEDDGVAAAIERLLVEGDAVFPA
jgi:hydroxymethylpyrimidine pyrophosphatase-like HAD family hydrolase